MPEKGGEGGKGRAQLSGGKRAPLRLRTRLCGERKASPPSGAAAAAARLQQRASKGAMKALKRAGASSQNSSRPSVA